MGGGVSVKAAIDENKAIKEFVGTKAYAYEAKLWKSLVTFKGNFSDLNMFEVQGALAPLWSELATNNPQTKNFEQLIRHLIFDLDQFTTKSTWQQRTVLVNNLAFARTIIIWMIENLSDADFCRQFFSPQVLLASAPKAGNKKEKVSQYFAPLDSGLLKSLAYQFYFTLMNFVVRVGITTESYHVHLEVLNLMLSLLSTQFYRKIHESFPAVASQHKMTEKKENNEKKEKKKEKKETKKGKKGNKKEEEQQQEEQEEQQEEEQQAEEQQENENEEDVQAYNNHFLNMSLISSEQTAQLLKSVDQNDEKMKGFYEVIKNHSTLVSQFTQRLIENYISLLTVPDDPNRGVITKVATWAFYSALYIPSRVVNYIFPADPDEIPLSEASLHVLLALSYHQISFSNSVANNPADNHYLNWIAKMTDRGGSDLETGGSVTNNSISFEKAYKAFCQRYEAHTVLLLSLFLQHNHSFFQFVAQRKDLSLLLPGFLRSFYYIPNDSAELNNVFMWLTALLILSSNPTFVANVTEQKFVDSSFIEESSMNNASCQSVTVAVLARCAIDLLDRKENSLFFNCVAVIANLSLRFDNLHPFAAEQLVELFDFASSEFCKENADSENPSIIDKQMILTLIDIFSSVVTTKALKNNSKLLCAIYGKQDLFGALANQSKSPEVSSKALQAQRVVIDIWETFQEQQKLVIRSSKNQSMIPVIETQITNYISSNDLPDRKEADRLFSFSVEKTSSKFMLCYVWSVIFIASAVFWDREKMTAFNMEDWLPDHNNGEYTDIDELFGLSGNQAQQEQQQQQEMTVAVARSRVAATVDGQ